MDDILIGAASVARQGLGALARVLAFFVIDVAMEIVFYQTTRLLLAATTFGRVTVQPLDQGPRRDGVQVPAGRIQIGAELAMVIGLAVWSMGLVCFTLWGGGWAHGVV